MVPALSFLKMLLPELTYMCVCWQGADWHIDVTIKNQHEFEFLSNGLRYVTKSAWKGPVIGGDALCWERKGYLWVLASEPTIPTSEK